MSQTLTEISVRALKGGDAYKTYWDSTPGFGVRVGKRAKTFVVVRGKTRERISLGRVGEISLADARAEAKRLLATAPEPKVIRKTFAEARALFVEEHYRDKGAGTKYQVKIVLEKHAASLDDLQLPAITDTHIKKALDAVADRPSTQLHLYRYLRVFFRWVARPPRRYITRSPMEGYDPPGRDRRGTRILSDDELRAVWNACDTPRTAIFRILILWGSRNTETSLLGRVWKVDDVLTIPGSVTKNNRDHSIPVLPLAEATLKTAWGSNEHYFAGRFGDGHLSPTSLGKMHEEVLEASGTKDWQIRDLRRTFRSNMARLGVSREVCEVLINHAPPVLDDIYDRYDRLPEKRTALAKYEEFVQSLVAQGST
ncbi:tyrosine-type recombinase/integrase [Brevundimonas sp.]|uniref:tyrosine-type recombinase/integrase n=1 Tax=Brevundimonas sp. TaxID=1871086 RepID=UPI003D12381D